MHDHECMHRIVLLCDSAVITCIAADKLKDVIKRHAIYPSSDHLTILLVMNSQNEADIRLLATYLREPSSQQRGRPLLTCAHPSLPSLSPDQETAS